MLSSLFFLSVTLGAVRVSAGVLPRQSSSSILIGNDDGWAEANVRAFYNALNKAGHDALISAPTEDKSGSGSSSTDPTPLTSEGEYGTIPVGAPAEGHDANDDHIWYVNAYPVDGIKFGLSNLTKTYFGGNPTIVATGPNVGSNLGISTLFSGTVGAAVEGVNSGIPAIAFSGSTDVRHSYTELQDGDASSIYAELATTLVEKVIASGTPYLPDGVLLNVNFPEAGPGTSCTSASNFKFVQSRVYWHLGLPIDAETCGSNVLPTESDVVGTDGCFASVSAMKSSNKLDAEKADQATVNQKLSSFLTCLP